MKTYDYLDFLFFKALASDKTVYDVAVYFTDRYFTIEHYDSKGKLLDEGSAMPLRRSRLEKFRQQLAELGLLDWQVTAEYPKTYGARITYSFRSDEENDFATEADGDLQKIKALHHLLEELTNRTFGSYQFYEETK